MRLFIMLAALCICQNVNPEYAEWVERNGDGTLFICLLAFIWDGFDLYLKYLK